jgi:O-6-methylguanine DNA methyltransferase
MKNFVGELRSLGAARAPASLLPAVLAEIGLWDSYARFDAPIGQCYVAYNRLGVSAVMRAATDADFEQAFQARFDRPIRRSEALPSALRRALTEWSTRSERGELSFDLRGLSEFEAAVLRKTLEIPPGEVRPYSWIAREIGSPRAVRAVGSALADNPIPLLIPCHRVVRRDGTIGQYGFGAEAKRRILEQEGIDPEALEQLGRSGVRYLGSTTTNIFCFPTCRHARRVQPQFSVTFRSEDEAQAMGYRACKVCRPA